MDDLNEKGLDETTRFVMQINDHNLTQAMLKVMLRNQAVIIHKLDPEHKSEDELMEIFTKEIDVYFKENQKSTMERVNKLAK